MRKISGPALFLAVCAIAVAVTGAVLLFNGSPIKALLCWCFMLGLLEGIVRITGEE
jgi:hypothetical protein